MLRDGNNKLHNGTVVAKFNERIANVGGAKVFYPDGTPYWTISTQNSSYAYEVVETVDGDYKMSAVSKQETRYFRPFMVF